MEIWRIVAALGRTFVGVGVLILLFVVYLLWGTGITESSHQRALKSQFDRALAKHEAPSRTLTTTTTGPLSPSSRDQQLTFGGAATQGQPVAIIDIPKIRVDKVVVQGTAAQDLRLGPGHYVDTPLPGQQGNAAIAGHRTTYGAPFSYLNQLSPGDAILVTTLQGHFTYQVTASLVVVPSDTSVLSLSTTPMLTLTTCNPRFSAAQRLVVQAALVVARSSATSPLRPSESGKSPVRRSGQLAGTQGPWVNAALWGAGAFVFGMCIWLLGRPRRSRLARWGVYGAGGMPMLVLLYFFFENVSPLLPASF